MNKKNDYINKYEFEIKRDIPNNNQINLDKQSPFEIKNHDEDIKQINNSSNLKVDLQLNNTEEIKKIKADSRTYYQNLKRKVILNFKLTKIVFDNFYRDEFNKTRKSSYLMMCVPTFVVFSFGIISPYHPMISLAFNISFLGTLGAFIYNFNTEINQLSHMKYNEIGIEIRKIKNEMVLYSSLAKPILDKDLNTEIEIKKF